MKTRTSVITAICVLVALIAVSAMSRAGEVIDSKCANLNKPDIPVMGYQYGLEMPQDNLTINQEYNTTYDDGFWSGGTWMYGHDGLDTEGASDTPGVNDVYAMFDGIVILSKNLGFKKGWGESIIVATRLNEHSEEILTHHYHHLHATKDGEDYATTRVFNACDKVDAGEVIAKEGTTGSSNGSHLHLSVRRWGGMAELNDAIDEGGNALRGYGYTFGDDSKLARNLDPERFLFNTFSDYEWSASDQPPAYAWSYPYALQMRIQGIDFGLYDGRFGAGEPVTRGQAARWIKIGAGLYSSTTDIPTFTDVPAPHQDSPYVETLVRYPATRPILNPDRTCVEGQHRFCPDAEINRAEALKMIIMAFYANEFMDVYDNTLWKVSFQSAVALLQIFVDVPAIAWYAPYIYFGVTKGLVTEQTLFHPEETIMKEEIAKWIVMGMQNKGVIQNSVCWNVNCPPGTYCSGNNAECILIPACVPSETVTCDVGGGYVDPNPDPDPDPDPDPEPCPQGQFVCGNVCCYQGQICENGYCADPQTCQCASGICCDGCNFRPATDICEQWYDYRCEGPNSGQNALRGTVRKYCTGWSSSCDGQTQPPGWQTYEDCSSSQVCEMQDGMPECVGTCADTYTADFAEACYGNPQGTGTPTLCLEVQKNSGSSFSYRMCKEGGTYQNSFTYRLRDDNNMVDFTQYSGSAGVSCTPWKDFSVSYVTMYGSVNAAGLHAEVVSPSGCTDPACKYRTGTVTVVKECI